MMYLIKQNNGFDFKIRQEPSEDTLTVENEIAKKLFYHELMWQNGELVKNPQNISADKEQEKQAILSQIEDLKQKLFDTDYQAIKYAEGELSFSEYEPIKNQRKMWRVKINELEKQIENM